MNKKSRINLIVLLAVVLLLAIAIPALATEESPACFLIWRAYDEKEEVNLQVDIRGDVEYILDGNELTKICTGTIPLGETPYNPHQTYLNLDDMRVWLCDTFGEPACNIGKPFILGTDEVGGRSLIHFYKGESYETTDFWIRVWENGRFRYEGVFDISE